MGKSCIRRVGAWVPDAPGEPAIIRALQVTLCMDYNEPATVEIFGQTYSVRGEGDPDYLMELARFVDTRMRDVAAKVSTVDPMKIAILAALNIADEFSRYRKEREHAEGIRIGKTEEISDRLSKVLG
jgi:cell division protein ZapA